jgi:Ala-tRNA(Pro) deacylase
MSCKDNLEAHLREHRVPFQVHHHPQAYSAQRVAQAEHVSGKMMAKVVIAFADGKVVMIALPAPRKVSLTKAAEATGAQEVRLAHEDEFAATFPDCEVGAMPPFGNLYGIPVYVDAELAEDETIVFNAGTHQDTIYMKYADFERLVKPAQVSLSAA